MLNTHTAEEAATIPASMWESHVISPAYACSLGITVKSFASAVPTVPCNVPAIWPCWECDPDLCNLCGAGMNQGRRVRMGMGREREREEWKMYIVRCKDIL